MNNNNNSNGITKKKILKNFFKIKKKDPVILQEIEELKKKTMTKIKTNNDFISIPQQNIDIDNRKYNIDKLFDSPTSLKTMQSFNLNKTDSIYSNTNQLNIDKSLPSTPISVNDNDNLEDIKTVFFSDTSSNSVSESAKINKIKDNNTDNTVTEYWDNNAIFSWIQSPKETDYEKTESIILSYMD